MQSDPHIRHYKALTTRTGHYYTTGRDDPDSRAWLALHGYGQRANHLIRKFDILDPEKHLVIAPEGLSRFYWEGVNGKVVASWMTSADRLDEIADYVHWLEKVARITAFGSASSATLFGFSQGCATAWRWMLNVHPRIDSCVMWSGWLPEDMQYQDHLDYLSRIKLIYVHGQNDPFYQPDRYQVLLQRFEDAGLHPEIIVHEGGHQVDRTLLAQIADSL